jgi:WD40 repeat protein
MIQRFYVLLLQALITSLPLLAMERSVPLHCEYAIPEDKRCFSVAFCGDKLFIAGTYGVEIYNNQTKKITHLSNQPTFHIAAHPHKPYLAVSHETELTVYNTETEKKAWQNLPTPSWRLTSIAFNSTDLTIYAYHRGLLTRYNQNESLAPQQFTIPFEIKHPTQSSQISCHPTKKKFLYPSKKQTISIIAENPDCIIRKNITFPEKNYISSAEYSPDATTIITKDSNKRCCLYDLTDNSFHYLASPKFHSAAFHPKKTILALLTNDGAIQYRNYKTRQLIATTNMYHNNPSTKKLFSPAKRLDFSKDGKYLAVGLAHVCLVLPVPLNNLMMICFLLHYDLPYDIIKIIIHLLPHALDMHHFDFFELLKI